MTSLTIYHLKSCDTCRKALKALRAAGHNIKAVDVRADGMKPAELAAAEQALGWEALLNTRSATWRGLSEAQRADMSGSKALTLMQAHPTLMKRPVIMGEQTTAGWTKAQQDVWL